MEELASENRGNKQLERGRGVTTSGYLTHANQLLLHVLSTVNPKHGIIFQIKKKFFSLYATGPLETLILFRIKYNFP